MSFIRPSTVFSIAVVCEPKSQTGTLPCWILWRQDKNRNYSHSQDCMLVQCSWRLYKSAAWEHLEPSAELAEGLSFIENLSHVKIIII